MKISKVGTIVLGIALIISISVAAVVGIANIGLQSELSDLEIELNSTQAMLQDNVTRLQEKTENRTNTELFIKTYLSGIGIYYNAMDVEDTATYKYNRAEDYYDSGNWFSGVGYYDDAMDYYSNAREEYRDAQDVFKNASNYTTNQTFKNINTVYSNMMDSKSKSMTYLYEAAEYMSAACQFYLDGNYEAAHDRANKANEKITFSDEQLTIFNTHLAELNAILLGLN